MQTRNIKFAALIGTTMIAFLAVCLTPPVLQDPDFHVFADTQSAFGIANFACVVTNAGFLAVGLVGLWKVLGPGRRHLFPVAADAIPYAVLFAGVAAVTAGSSAYHLAPDNETLLGDRLPIVVAFMGFLGAVICDRVDRKAGLLLLPGLLAAAAAAVFYWYLTDTGGAGDLRFYAFAQFFPMALVPLILVLFPRGRLTNRGDITIILATYGVAALLHAYDAEVFDLLGGAIGGHSLKHLVAALASWRVVTMLGRAAGGRRPRVLHVAS